MSTNVTSSAPRRARVYPLAFVTAGLLAEAVLLVLRAIGSELQQAAEPIAKAIAAELARDGLTYAYLALMVALGLGWLGVALGQREDALRVTSVTDSLTRVVNRRGVDAALALEVKRAREAHMPLALLVLDIDRFKALNDELGHEAGDLALQRLGDVLRVTCRSRDLPGRLGGDEFVVVLPRTTADEAEVLAERIRDTLANLPARTVRSGGLERPFSVSIGVASLDDVVHATPAELLEAADRALYHAKAEGRNRVARSERALRIVTPLPLSVRPPLQAVAAPLVGRTTRLPDADADADTDAEREEVTRIVVSGAYASTCPFDRSHEQTRLPKNLGDASCAGNAAPVSERRPADGEPATRWAAR